MKIYWTLKQIPELRDLPMYQRIWVWWACRLKDWKFDLIVGLVYFAIVFTGLQLIVGFKLPARNEFWLFFLIIFLPGFISSVVSTERLPPHFRRYLDQHKLT